jgi:hypothetical protein
MSPPAVVVRDNTFYDVFAVGTDGAVYQRAWNYVNPSANSLNSSAWTSLRGSMYDISAIQFAPQRVALVGRARDGTIRRLIWSPDPVAFTFLAFAAAAEPTPLVFG